MNLYKLKDLNVELVSTNDLEKLHAVITAELQERDMGKRYRLMDIERAWGEAFGAASIADKTIPVK
jgi:hypothetical protein